MRVAAKWAAGFGFSVLMACGKGATPAADAGATAPITATASGDDAGSTAADAAADAVGEAAADGAVNAADAAEDDRAARLERLAALEVPGLTRVRSHVQRELATVQLDTPANAKGNSGSVELTASICDDCTMPKLADLEARKDQLKAQLGELHAKNPSLVLDLKELELLPQRVGLETYSRSFVDDGTTRAAVHMLEVTFVDNGFTLRFQAYPRNGLPATADEQAAAFTREELEGAVKTVFKVAADVLWPPSKPAP